MALGLAESKVIGEIAKQLYDYLPGTPHPRADQRISFPAVAQETGLGEFWMGGSKLPAITSLLELTLERRREKFCDLVKNVVKRGLVYRARKNEVTREDVEQLNDLIQKVHFKIPDLWDPSFLQSLPRRKPEPPKVENQQGRVDYPLLRTDFSRILNLEPTQRGYAFEEFLNKVFNAFGLSPRAAFRLTGEQIDGSFVLDSDTYLLEAKWENKPTAQPDLLILREKVEARATWARGVFVSYTGFSDDGIVAFSRGRNTNIVGVTGLDLHEILERQISLPAVLREKVRKAVETGEFYLPVSQLRV